jgi:hypothetical protein
MKNSLRRIFTIPNIVVILSALYICFQIYELPSKVKNLQERVYVIERENIILKTKLDLCLNMISEMKTDVKQLLKDIK